MTSFEVATTAHSQMVDVTERVRTIVRASGVRDGACLVFVPHTTAAVTVQENADPAVQRDLLAGLAQVVPDVLPGGGFQHREGNSPAHVKATMVGNSLTVPVEGGELMLGTWQAIYLCEFDGPRTRQVLVKLLRG